MHQGKTTQTIKTLVFLVYSVSGGLKDHKCVFLTESFPFLFGGLEILSAFFFHNVLKSLKLVYIQWLQTNKLIPHDQGHLLRSVHSSIPRMEKSMPLKSLTSWGTGYLHVWYSVAQRLWYSIYNFISYIRYTMALPNKSCCYTLAKTYCKLLLSLIGDKT